MMIETHLFLHDEIMTLLLSVVVSCSYINNYCYYYYVGMILLRHHSKLHRLLRYNVYLCSLLILPYQTLYDNLTISYPTGCHVLLERWTLEELSGVMHVPPGLLRRRLGFWISQGVLKEETSDTFVVVEKQKGHQRIPGMLISLLRSLAVPCAFYWNIILCNYLYQYVFFNFFFMDLHLRSNSQHLI